MDLTVVLVVLAGWVVLSLPLAVVVGRAIARHQHPPEADRAREQERRSQPSDPAAPHTKPGGSEPS